METGHGNRRRAHFLIVLLSAVVLFGLWYAFRPEKLFINKSVNEAAPDGVVSGPTSLYTGRIGDNIHGTSGRATVVKSEDGTLHLELTDFSASNCPDAHLRLLEGENVNVDSSTAPTSMTSIDLGQLDGNRGDQNLAIPPQISMDHFQIAAIYCIPLHAYLGTAKLEPF
jgi:hypothetical protein